MLHFPASVLPDELLVSAVRLHFADVDVAARVGPDTMRLGLAEVWEDRDTNNVFWRGVPESIYDESRHFSRLSKVSENVDNINAIIELIKKVNVSAPVILTLSPVPLKATFQEKSCVTADCVSKSILRVALHEVMETAGDNVYYWPSFEIIKWIGCHVPYAVFGPDDGATRHVSRHMVLHILVAFVRAFFGPEVTLKVFSNYTPSSPCKIGEPGQPPRIYPGVITRVY